LGEFVAVKSTSSSRMVRQLKAAFRGSPCPTRPPSPPWPAYSSEYPSLSMPMQERDKRVANAQGRRRYGFAPVACMAPSEASTRLCNCVTWSACTPSATEILPRFTGLSTKSPTASAAASQKRGFRSYEIGLSSQRGVALKRGGSVLTVPHWGQLTSHAVRPSTSVAHRVALPRPQLVLCHNK
jgi:hypothetical protein